MKKTLSVFTVILAVCIGLSACARRDERADINASVSVRQSADSPLVGDDYPEFPLCKSPRDMNVLITGYNGYDQKDVFVWRKYGDMTNVRVNWTTVTKEKRAETVHNALVNGKKLDLILRCKLSANRLTQYGNSGLILDLAKDGLLEKNAPNCWAYLKSHPDTMASVMNPDGSIYALAQVNSGPELRVALKLFVNRKWLERLGLDIPKTTDEFRALLMAFKQNDANGNGDPNDEIPMSSADWASVKMSLYGAFGLCNRGYHNETVDCDPDTGKVRWVEGCDRYRDYLEYTRGLYADGLLDKYSFSLTVDQWAGKVANDLVGVFASTNLALLPADKVDDWVAIDEALEGPYADKLWSPIRANFHSTGAAVVPATCEDPALALRWLDYFWTDEGTLFYHMGVEGETFRRLDDGTYDYMPYIYEEMSSKNLPYDDVVAEYSPYPGGSNPTVEIAPYFMGGEMAKVPANAARGLFDYGPEEYWPSFTFTPSENEELNAMQTDLEKYCDGMQRAFVTGEIPMSEWENYINKIDGMKLCQTLLIYQNAVDRYNALN